MAILNQVACAFEAVRAAQRSHRKQFADPAQAQSGPMQQNSGISRESANGRDFSYLTSGKYVERVTEAELLKDLIKDLEWWVKQALPTLPSSRKGPALTLHALVYAIHDLKEEMKKLEREFCSLDLDPKEFAILEVVLKVARNRLNEVGKPEEMRCNIQLLVKRSILHRHRKIEAWQRLHDAYEGLEEARKASQLFRIGISADHRRLNKLKDDTESKIEQAASTPKSNQVQHDIVPKFARPVLPDRQTTDSSANTEISSSNFIAVRPPQMEL